MVLILIIIMLIILRMYLLTNYITMLMIPTRDNTYYVSGSFSKQLLSPEPRGQNANAQLIPRG